MFEKGNSTARAVYLASAAALLFLSVTAQSAPVAPAAKPPNKHAAVPAETAGSADFSHIKSLGGIDEYRLDGNGLTVLLVPDHSAPVVTFEVTYQVGSRNEVTGTTGATHILEHLMFKGSDAFNDVKGNSIKQMLERVGGQFNATTSFDRTNYFATIGRENLESYIAIEADRMRHLWLHESDRQAEMTVVRNEYERGKNDPENVLLEEVMEAAYVALPYHHPTIGWKSDIEHVPIAKLREFYDTFYWPNNAVVTVVGDIDSDSVLGLIKKYYGVYPRSPAPIPAVYTEEPAQSGERRVVVKRPGELGTIIVAHKVPNGRDADQAALEMLDAILSSGKNGRLYRTLVDQGLALSAGAGIDLLHDLSLHTLYAALTPGTSHEQVENALVAELNKIKTNGVTPAEVATVKQQFTAEDAYKRDGTAAVASELSEWIGVGDWTLYVTFPQKVQQVSPADVQRVAKQYFGADQSTVGWFVPVAPKTEKGS
ncbi:MAG TPA: pitrilysin family protein [Steroidobacteraceae bacterium]|jgi:zinc protease|nr:pitrilysin family protein [Steroidobacteraceae bacterium]